MSRSTSQSSTATTNTSHGMSRSLSVKTNSKSLPQSLDALPASDVKLFVTNLRLLDLDLRTDWPGITVQTFSGKNADQRQRISGAEWALFRLFEIWDPNETAHKLQPFFPPLEPLQSLNLRAALYRSLNELKKNGTLGRESVLRKTMLDECKGEKFFEILAIFSNAALKKVLAARGRADADAAIALKLATAPMLSAPQQQSLLPLAIAHRTALVTLLKKKEVRRRRYREFEALLDSKAEDINRRIRKSKDTPRANRPAISQKDADAVKKQLEDNWIGNQKWLDVMMHGDDVQTGEAFLGSRFDKIWRMVEHGRKLEDVTPETGLLDSLQSRVQEQQERLRKWVAFHERLQQEKHQPTTTASKAPVVTKEYKFDSHLQFQLPSSKPNATHSKPAQRPDMEPEYRGILDEMNTELSRIKNSKPARDIIPSTKRRTPSSGVLSPARSRKNIRSESKPSVPISPTRSRRPSYPEKNPSLEQAPVLLPPRRVPFTATPADSDATLIGYTSGARSITSATYPSDSLAQGIESPGPELNTTTITFDAPQEPPPSPPVMAVEDSPQPVHRSPSPEPRSAYPSEPPIPIVEPPELNTEEALAEQIITSIGDATPSPVKRPQPRMPMSLIERTRMSMARTNSFEHVAESPLPLPSPQLPEILTIEADTDRGATLLERTRLSMMSMQAKPRQTLSARQRKEKQQSRQSLFPVNQFDTPRNRKSFEIIEESKSTDPELTPKEALFNDEIDYDRVFKSRPRIATSPVFSPPPNDNEEDYDEEDVDGVTGIDLGDVDQDEDDDGFTKSWADSPSRMRAGKVKY
ncbi:HAUS augmin-like complex subunit 6 N-terminus-domain-containing protein [Ampelomyces quisqualis]|uniref:HAUS augmin-like complex subunit 6 N-terminus-domain-containing protein n=1 Tax=Ampelomyces quisqualis TaxID=50730 RepID=A0A6A5QD78_AMPQU|nr:HAUS augmin-like complex subunit 6 N-terminus-domain-containing protein [Ampelomyces quisqualis]